MKKMKELKKKQKIEDEKLKKRNEAYLKICAAADVVLKKDKHTWNTNDYKTVLRPLKDKNDGKMPNKKTELEQKWLEWCHRSRRPIVDVCGEIHDDVNEDDADNDDMIHTEV